jgi:solute carrier family 35 (adenosine 3'-phospho 5'-phosphosulfate transporter), member B2
VFSNRAFAIVVASIACLWRHGTVQSAASWLSFSPPALSNTVSSWAQYESLSYVSFPLQNLFKSTKLIPVMIMGRLLNNTSYSITEIMEAVVISIGVLIFSMEKGKQSHNVSGGVSVYDSSVHGILLLGVYIVSDSFTSQYQTAIYKQYGKIDQFHMMFGVNLSAMCITTFALLIGGEIAEVIEFLYYNPLALVYNVITAITSATGQLFIYYTIKTFGPVVFTIIMTTRQIVSMVISTIYFNHPLPLSSILGAVIVFCAVFHSIHRQTQKAQMSR